MRIGISDLNARKARQSGLVLFVCASLSACVSGEGLSFGQKSDGESAKTRVVVPKTTQATLARGAVKLKAPKGYCIDETSISNGPQGSSALLAQCSSLDGKGAGAGTAVMSVQISARRGAAAGAPTAQDLAMAALPRKTLKTKQKGTLALVQLGSGGNDIFAPADPIHWRGATMLDTRLVLLSLYAPDGSDLSSDKGADLLTTLARGMSAKPGTLLGLRPAPSEQADKKQSEVAAKTSATEKVETERKAGPGIIARLLNRS